MKTSYCNVRVEIQKHNCASSFASRKFERLRAADSSRFHGSLETLSVVQFEATSHILRDIGFVRGCKMCRFRTFLHVRIEDLNLNKSSSLHYQHMVVVDNKNIFCLSWDTEKDYETCVRTMVKQIFHYCLHGWLCFSLHTACFSTINSSGNDIVLLSY